MFQRVDHTVGYHGGIFGDGWIILCSRPGKNNLHVNEKPPIMLVDIWLDLNNCVEQNESLWMGSGIYTTSIVPANRGTYLDDGHKYFFRSLQGLETTGQTEAQWNHYPTYLQIAHEILFCLNCPFVTYNFPYKFSRGFTRGKHTAVVVLFLSCLHKSKHIVA